MLGHILNKMEGRKNILCFGARSFLARNFSDAYSEVYNIVKVSRTTDHDIYFDFEQETSIDDFTAKLNKTFDGVIFFQGLNPTMGFNDITYEHFLKMLKVNIILPSLLIQSIAPKLNKGCSVIFFSSIAKRKGSYDPSYASAKAGIIGLAHSLANACSDVRFNIISLGLVEESPVHINMTTDFIERHSHRMFQRKLIDSKDVIRIINELLINKGFNRADIEIDGGYT